MLQSTAAIPMIYNYDNQQLVMWWASLDLVGYRFVKRVSLVPGGISELKAELPNGSGFPLLLWKRIRHGQLYENSVLYLQAIFCFQCL